MRHLPQLFANNRAWASRQIRQNPEFFARLCAIQAPRYLWIGCADSRVPANEIVGLAPGELFVHRNVANVVRSDDFNGLAVLQYAIEILHIRDVIICGHYGCGGVQAALGAPVSDPLEHWIKPIRAVRRRHADDIDSHTDAPARWRRLCELNVMAQVQGLSRLPILAAAWAAGRCLNVHGWIYDLKDGLLRDLDVSVTRAPPEQAA
ncbi:MAG TPA: carbonic anhydrase [Elusimicrobia bacterium]|nr:MAG: carbonic anhydrase [Elusimicrobia bacterium GWA2_66_18]OGR76755.1 MAG: carbonic anhydrase [Elusimicrobia bacterium GWC2_65_9]HAZ08687.1 carbonic anhydrase [Elusimicrobiota bacterium]